jgi:hypothetical protein
LKIGFIDHFNTTRDYTYSAITDFKSLQHSLLCLTSSCLVTASNDGRCPYSGATATSF